MSIVARCLSLPRALKIVTTQTGGADSSFDEQVQQQLARSLDLVLSADLLMFKPVCWKRAAVLHRFLARKGVTTQICFGVRNEKSKTITGHAWLEHNGIPILEKSPPDYVVTYTFPSNEQFNLQLATLSNE